jgi:hypothetical protein
MTQQYFVLAGVALFWWCLVGRPLQFIQEVILGYFWGQSAKMFWLMLALVCNYAAITLCLADVGLLIFDGDCLCGSFLFLWSLLDVVLFEAVLVLWHSLQNQKPLVFPGVWIFCSKY